MNWSDLGFPPAPAKIVVAMSGGVDSSVAAALLKEAGYDVIGITLQLYDAGLVAGKKGKTCCAGQDIYDASEVAAQFGFPHYVLDYESVFKQSVMDDFAESYMRGETPIPCVRCNQQVKFKDLLKTAKDLGAQALATGHYVQWKMGPTLHQAVDPFKDQSYFLFTTTPEQLDFIRFPLGALTKQQTRAHAERLGLKIADKPDSQDICFVPQGNYADIVMKLRPEALMPGEIVHENGTVLGSHEGIIHYTVGQRRGLGIGGRKDDEQPLYVLRLDPEARRVIVGPYTSLGQKEFYLYGMNWLEDKADVSCEIKIRSAHQRAPAQVFLLPDACAKVVLDTPEHGISPGQACVCYSGTRVLGGGWIMRQNVFPKGVQI